MSKDQELICADDDCKHECKESEQHTRPSDDGIGRTHICPKCGNDEFYYKDYDDVPDFFKNTHQI